MREVTLSQIQKGVWLRNMKAIIKVCKALEKQKLIKKNINIFNFLKVNHFYNYQFNNMKIIHLNHNH